MIYDLCTVFNELPTLELRLKVLDPIVDLFVIAEADSTFTGISRKRLIPEFLRNYVPMNIHRKIRYIPISLTKTSAWDRERELRNSLLDGLWNIKDDDYAIIADVDEIPKPDKILEALPKVDKHNVAMLYLTWLQQKATQKQVGIDDCQATYIFNKKALDMYGTIQRIRNCSDRTEVVYDAGWHFSSMGGPEAIKAKLQSFAHTEYNIPSIVEDAKILERYTKGIDVLNRSEVRLESYPLDQLPPEIFIVHNKEYFGL